MVFLVFLFPDQPGKFPAAGQETGHYLRATIRLLSGEYDRADDDMNKSFALRFQIAATTSKRSTRWWKIWR